MYFEEIFQVKKTNCIIQHVLQNTNKGPERDSATQNTEWTSPRLTRSIHDERRQIKQHKKHKHTEYSIIRIESDRRVMDRILTQKKRIKSNVC